jgi:predicted nucleic acid-binding protein
LVVLDTNAALDWLLFAAPAMTDLSAAIVGARVRWIATAAMHREFTHVLERGLAAGRGVAPTPLQAAWSTHCAEVPAPQANAKDLRCTDASDQMFVDLALATGARWLVSRDRAVLDLRRRAARLGLDITPPEGWLR